VKRVAVIAHGAASSADFILRAFTAPLQAVGYEVVSWDRRTPVQEATDEFAGFVTRANATIVGGVSVGAILAMRYALSPAGTDLDGLLVALPPPRGQASTEDSDTGPPPDIQALIDEVAQGAVPWVADEIRAAWPKYQPTELIRELTTASRAMPPGPEELARCKVPTGIVALADDPLHPLDVAEMWARMIPSVAVETVQLSEPAGDVAVIGAAAVRAWQRAISL
jgi:pimeloyl-ACP methyl ester carboxylesterase